MKKIRLMEVCGTHTVAIARAALKPLLPPWIELISGPGCPVCVTAQADIDRAIETAAQKDVIMTTFGDMLRVPGRRGSLERTRGKGSDVRVVYSCLDALNIACANPQKKIVFMGIGFETTSPTVALTILEAKKRDVQNFYILSNFKLIFPALAALAQSDKARIDGFICPGHVSVITGSLPYQQITARYGKPCVITGFTEQDIVRGIKYLVRQIQKGECKVEIAYKRVVKKEGNPKARAVLNSVFTVCDAQWRGLGMIPGSGLKLKEEFAEFSAERCFKIHIPKSREYKGCMCGEILQGLKLPAQCGLFGKQCTPQNPLGPCMVSSEGACAAHYIYR
ncbi:MAG: hydrogenase formation protein HypD [Candidatus Omnitrophota bacterium]